MITTGSPTSFRAPSTANRRIVKPEKQEEQNYSRMRDLKKAEKAEKRQAKVIAAELKKSEQSKIMSQAMPVM